MIDMHDLDDRPGGLERAIRKGDVAFVCRRRAKRDEVTKDLVASPDVRSRG